SRSPQFRQSKFPSIPPVVPSWRTGFANTDRYSLIASQIGSAPSPVIVSPMSAIVQTAMSTVVSLTAHLHFLLSVVLVRSQPLQKFHLPRRRTCRIRTAQHHGTEQAGTEDPERDGNGDAEQHVG